MFQNLGEGIANLYMRPYNFKVWATPTTLLQIDWLGDKTFKPMDIKQSIENIILGRRCPAPKVSFRFPKVRQMVSSLVCLSRGCGLACATC